MSMTTNFNTSINIEESGRILLRPDSVYSGVFAKLIVKLLNILLYIIIKANFFWISYTFCFGIYNPIFSHFVMKIWYNF